MTRDYEQFSSDFETMCLRDESIGVKEVIAEVQEKETEDGRNDNS
jgi:hypothetical protein